MLPTRPVLLLLTLCLLAAAPALAAENLVQKSGKYLVTLRLPAGGVFAGAEADLGFRLTDTARPEPEAGVARAKIAAGISSPAMPALPKLAPAVHAGGVPGDYRLTATFARGGEYRIELTIAPPGEDRPFTATFPLEVGNAGAAESAPAPFTLEVSADPARPAAGRPAILTLGVRARDTGKTVRDFDLVHEEQLRVSLVREDLGAFFHETAEPGPDGRFTLRFTFPTGGDWRLFADVAPRGAGAQVLPATLAVEGPRGMRAALLPALRPAVRQSGMTLMMQPMNLAAGKTLSLPFTIGDASGRPLTDLQFWRGGVAHLIFVASDARTLVHAFPDETDPRHGRSGNLVFLVRFPKAGIYRGWMQIQRRGTVHALPFAVRVAGER